MSIYIKGSAIYHGDGINYGKSGLYAAATSGSDRQRLSLLDAQPALLLVVDKEGYPLLSSVGETAWEWGADDGPHQDPYRVELKYRRSSEVLSEFVAQPAQLYLRIILAERFALPIKRAGHATKAYLIVDPTNTYSDSDASGDDSGSAWPADLLDPDTIFDPETLASTYRYIEISVGGLESDASIKLTRTELDPSDGDVAIIDYIISVYMPNLLHDHSSIKAELKALLDTIPQVGQAEEEILAKEAAAAAEAEQASET